MSANKAVTLSMDSLNRLYFQFIQKFVNPNLLKPVSELAQVLSRKTAYEVHRYLQELMKQQQQTDIVSSNQTSYPSSSLNSSVSSLTFNLTNSNSNNKNQKALPTNTQNHKTAGGDHLNSLEKEQDKSQDSISFKSKVAVRKAYTGLAKEQTPKLYQFKHFSDDLMYPSSPYSNTVSSQKKIDLSGGKDILLHMPVLVHNSSVSVADPIIEDFQVKSQVLKDIVRKVGKVFNQNHSKIQKYNKSNQSNRIFNLNISSKLDKNEDNVVVKQYQYKLKTDYSMRKF